MSRPRFAAIAVLLVLAALIVYALTRGNGPVATGPEAPATAGSAETDSRQAPVKTGEAPVEEAADRETGDVGMTREEVAAKTTLSGTFTAPGGRWPGGGVALLLPRAEAPEGGMMGVFSAGMELAREREPGVADPRRAAFERRMAAWLGRAEPAATVAVDPTGSFEFREPPAGDWTIGLRHSSLRVGAPADVEVVEDEHRDAGEVPTEASAGLLVVVSDEEGTPVPDARVAVARPVDPSQFMDPRALQDMGGLIRKLIPSEGRTDDNGRCLMSGLEPDALWNVRVERRGYVDGYREVRAASMRETIVRVALSRGAELRVTVRDPSGEPYDGGRLRLLYPDEVRPSSTSFRMDLGSGSRGGTNEEPLSFALETADDGVASRAGLPAGRAELRVVTPGFRRATQTLSIPVTGTVEATVDLDQGATVSGVVLDEHGDPIEDAHVLSMAALGQTVMGMDLESIVGLDLLTIGAEDRGVRTDEQGRFVFGGFEPDEEEVHLAAVAPRYDPARLDTTVGDHDVEFRLLRACALSGRVVDDVTGEPVPSFHLALRQRAFLVVDRPVVQRTIEESADGMFEVSPVPRQAFQLVVEADGYAASSDSVDLSEGSLDCGEIRLKLPAVIEGVTIGTAGAPIAGAKIRVSKGGPADSLFLAQLLGDRHVLTDELGRFRIDGLTGRAVRLLADAEGYAPLRSSAIRIETGETVEGVVLEMTRGGSIHGRIVDGEGNPHEGWQVQAENASGAGHGFARTDPDGAFVMDALAGGTYKVTGLPPDYMERTQWRPTDPSEFGDFDLGALISQAAEMTVEDRVVVRDGEVSEIVLVHDAAAEEGELLVTVEGEVRVGGRPLAHGMVALFPTGSTIPRHLADVSDGRFRLTGVPPGSYRMQTRAGLLSGDLGQARIVQIPEQTAYTLNIDLPGGAISGRVVDAESGDPVPSVLLTLSRPSVVTVSERMDVGEGAVLTDGDGRFRFDGLGEGTYDVFAKQWALGASGGRSGRLSGVVLGPGEVREGLELVLGRGGVLRVQVRSEGSPRANALVTLLGRHGDPIDLFHRTLTDRSGVAEFVGLPDGAYRASVDAPPAAPTVGDVVEIHGGGEASVDVDVHAGVPVTLRLVGEVPESWRGELLLYSVWRQDGALLRSGRVVVPGAGAAEAKARRGLSVGAYEPGTYRLRVEGGRLGVLDETRKVPVGDPVDWAIDVAALRRR